MNASIHTQVIELLASRTEVAFAERVRLIAGEVGMGFSETMELCAEAYGMQFMRLSAVEAFTPNFEFIGFADCQRKRFAFATEGEAQEDGTLPSLICLIDDPEKIGQHAIFEAKIESNASKFDVIRRVLLSSEDLDAFFLRAESGLRAIDSVTYDDVDSEGVSSEGILHLSMAAIEGVDNTTVRLVDSTLYDALKIGASDIHFETQNKVLHLKYRLDGVLLPIQRYESVEASTQVISRLKVLSDLDISETRVPQDGRFKAILDKREVDFRVSIMPNISGEDAVLRILDRRHLTGQYEKLTLDSLTFEEPVKQFIRQAAKLPHGLLLVTGPTGSGKTTTLYAVLTEINTGLDKIVTIEDPIEYQLAGVLQIPVNAKKDLTFAKGLRSVLRHDPDKIMVGEIRDKETAEIAVQASLTGHQVLTTIHANNVFDVFSRFLNMEVDAYSLVSALTGILAQRLVRMVCTQCSTYEDVAAKDVAEFVANLGGAPVDAAPFKRMRAVGCDHCRKSGYKGRAAIAETLYIDDHMKALLIQQAPITQIKEAARGAGFRSLRDSAINLVLRGLTTVEEIDRVTPVQ